MLYRISWQWCSLSAAFLLTLGLFLLAWAFPTFPGDERTLVTVQGYQTEWLDRAALGVSTLGLVPVAIAMIVGVSGSLLVLRRPVDALIVVFILVPMVAGNGLKVLVERPRPSYLLVGSAPESLSFPSGHALFAVLVGGILIFLVGQLVQPALLRRGLQLGIALVILAIGAARVYMGVHWPSDVLGGYLFGWLALLGLIALRKQIVATT